MDIFYIDFDKEFIDKFSFGRVCEVISGIPRFVNSYFLYKFKQLPTVGYYPVKFRAERADTISYELFNSVDEYWWLLLYFNNIPHTSMLKNNTLLKVFSINDLEALVVDVTTKQLVAANADAIESGDVLVDLPVTSSGGLLVYKGETLPLSEGVLWIKPSTGNSYVFNSALSLWVSTSALSINYGVDYLIANQYLKYASNTYSNMVTFITQKDILITDVVVSTDQVSTWSLEFRDSSLVLYGGGSFSISNLRNASFTNQIFRMYAGDVLRLYVNGTTLRPNVSIFYREVIPSA